MYKVLPGHVTPRWPEPFTHPRRARVDDSASSQSLLRAMTASQTAPVAEFKCLFTHDIKRKQKRWQDGFLKFHSFNSRVMVCDQSRNHVGDTYWKDSSELQEGDQLELDRGVLVEVAEAVGVTITDLTPLFEKKPREQADVPPARPAPSAQAVRPYQRPSSAAPSRVGTQLRHKSLNTLLGKSRGPVGKSVPIQSPYEARNEPENNVAQERPAKRQKIAQHSSAWRASSPAEEEPSPEKPLPTCPRLINAQPAKPRQRVARPVDVVTMSSEPDHIPAMTSDVTLPCLSPRELPKARKPSVTSPPTVIRKPSPIQTPKIPPRKVPVSATKNIETPKLAGPPSSPPVSASNRLTNVDFAVQSAKRPRKEQLPAPSPPRNPKARSLRLPSGVKRGTLMCQSFPQATKIVSAVRAASRPPANKHARSARKPPPPMDDTAVTQPFASNELTSPKSKRMRRFPDPVTNPARAMTPEQLPDAFSDDANDPQTVHGLLDQQLLISSPPVAACSPLSVSTNRTKSKSKKGAQSAEAVQNKNSLPPSPTKKPTTPQAETGQVLSAKRVVEEATSPAPAPVLQQTITNLRDAPPQKTESFENRPRDVKQPTKTALSTGGFRKKTQRTSKASSETPAVKAPAPPALGETALPPPLEPRASKKALLTTTTEPATVLQKPKKRSRAVDPIEKVGRTGKSPDRGFRRVRSENDAPIPSISEDWEKGNLPAKPVPNAAETESEMPEADTLPEPKTCKRGSLAALVKKTDPRRRLQRAKSLSVATSKEMQPNGPQNQTRDLPSPVVVDNDVGPWSTEAFDLFDWRPPRLRE